MKVHRRCRKNHSVVERDINLRPRMKPSTLTQQWNYRFQRKIVYSNRHLVQCS